MLEVKVLYGVAELGRLAGMSSKKVERVLKNAGVPIHQDGKVKEVYLSELKEYLPQLWDSLLTRRALRGNGEDED